MFTHINVEREEVYTYLTTLVKLSANNYSHFTDACTTNLHSLFYELIRFTYYC